MPNPVRNPDACRRAADYLKVGFDWEYSPEGHDFWSRIHYRLAIYGRGVVPTEPVTASPVVALQQLVETLEAERDSQAKTIVELRRKLLLADFVNMGR